MSIIEKAIKKQERQREVGHGGVVTAESKPSRPLHQQADTNADEKTDSADLSSDATLDQAVPIPDQSDRSQPKQPRQVVSLPLAKLNSLGMVTPDRPRSRIAEEYRLIKRPLLQNITDQAVSAVDQPNLIMVTSAIQGEGKTFTALNLAMSLSMEKDSTVLLVDADVVRGTAAKTLDISADHPGLIDLLENDAVKVEDVLLTTSIPNLRFLPAGQVHERSTELLASDSMRKLTKELAERYPDRVIIFDAPPLLLTTQARVLASLMGQIVFVVAAEQTSQQAVIEAIESIPGDRIIGTVLNKAKKHFWSRWNLGYGYYGYGYGYGYGSRSRKKDGEGAQQSKQSDDVELSQEAQ